MNDPVDVAVIGAGGWSERYHLPSLAAYPPARLTAVVDRDHDRAAGLADRFGAAEAFRSVEELLDRRPPTAAVVATPHTTHGAIAATLLDADVHVFVEKPLTTRAADAASLVRLAEDRGLHLGVGYTYQYTAAAHEVRGWLRSEFGRLDQVVIEFSSKAGELYASADPDDEGSAYSPRNGSGQATSQLSHAIGALIWSAGVRVEEVAAMVNARGTAVDVDDVVIMRLAGGGTGTAASTGTLARSQRLRHRISYFGAGGVIDHDLIGGAASFRRTDGSILETVAPHTEPAYPAGRPVRAFVDLVLGRGENHAPGRPAAEAVAVIEAVLRSAERRRFERVVHPFDDVGTNPDKEA